MASAFPLEGRDDIAQCGQRLVDSLSLFQTLPCRLALLDALTPRQVDQHQPAHLTNSCLAVGASDIDKQKAVGTRGMLVHAGSSNRAVGVGFVGHQAAHLLCAVHFHLRQPRDVDSAPSLSDVNLGSPVAVQQVSDLLVVHLHHANIYAVDQIRAHFPLSGHRSKHVVHSLVVDPSGGFFGSSFHCESLPRSSLPVGKNTHGEAVDCRVNQRFDIGEHFCLR
mmetsp:Transcript_6107/g.11554  ORF Transcript_6107/g.11554 Transcript_6107/m.11554 type:complete len:222 (-) Transcript_6107:1450-2115(-)